MCISCVVCVVAGVFVMCVVPAREVLGGVYASKNVVVFGVFCWGVLGFFPNVGAKEVLDVVDGLHISRCVVFMS